MSARKDKLTANVESLTGHFESFCVVLVKRPRFVTTVFESPEAKGKFYCILVCT